MLLLLGAGSGTTWKQMGTTLTALLQRPELLEAVRDDRQLLRPAIEESLRWMPTDPMFSRWVMADTELGGVEVPAGSVVHLAIGAANRDPARWDRPDEFDITRKLRPSLGFGQGVAYLSRHARGPRRDDHSDLGAARPAAQPAAGSRCRTTALRRHVRARGDRNTRALR